MLVKAIKNFGYDGNNVKAQDTVEVDPANFGDFDEFKKSGIIEVLDKEEVQPEPADTGSKSG